jgi:hypothetical protein
MCRPYACTTTLLTDVVPPVPAELVLAAGGSRRAVTCRQLLRYGCTGRPEAAGGMLRGAWITNANRVFAVFRP